MQINTLYSTNNYYTIPVSSIMKLRKGNKKIVKAQRERVRMLAINEALIYLRSILQSSLSNGSSDFESLPKIEVLRLAKNYINVLQHQLSGAADFTDNDFIEMLTLNLKNRTAKLLRRMILS